ncbi:NADH-quinone oxidoreductase subunit C [Neobacillus drentensis]|uniref:NADH-quinone oxidoreductase subunit C n=1 Tax=Neobacillus drentensis TaxID=220684 RepID=UPI002FFF3904
MSGEKDLEQLKKEAVAKAKAAAAAKRAAKAAGEAPSKPAEPAKDEAPASAASETPVEKTVPPTEAPATAPANDTDDLAKKKAAAVAKAKAAAAAKRKAMELAGATAPSESAPAEETVGAGANEAPAASSDADDLAKKKAAAVAKAKAAAAAKRKAMELGGTPEAAGDGAPSGDDAKAKAAAAAKAKAVAAAKAKAAAGGKAETAAPAAEEKPSVNQPFLDKYLKVIEENMGSDVLEDSYINKLSKDVPTLVARRETYFKLAQFLKYNELLGFDYLSELHGSDFETHMEIYVHLFSYKNRQSVALKVKIDRDEPIIESLQPLWAGAEWPECEAYDLLGIKFTGHPDLRRILLGEDWVGYPLRKDYEPYDVEV